MKKNLTSNLLMAFGVMALLAAAILLLTPSAATDELPPAEAASDTVTPQEGCELIQTLTYTRCKHTVVRRVTAPVEIYGQPLEEVQTLYPAWRITEFGAKQIKMEQHLQLFCPDHMVLMPDGAGMLCVFENKYGDALALVNELNIPVKNLPAAAQEEVTMGLGFSTAEEMEMWLESVES